MFKGNVKLIIEKSKGYDKFGQPNVLSIVHSRCSIVRLATESLRTSVRTDTSATGGNAHEMVADARLLMEVESGVEVGDKLTINGVSLYVDKIFVRNDVHGRPHHFQVDCSIWQ